MTGIRFVVMTIAVLLVLYWINRVKIHHYLNSSCLYYCWAIMLVSNLGFPSSIQYMTRLLGICISWVLIILKSRGHLIFKKNNAGGLLFIFLIFCMVSTLWSVSWVQTFMKSIELMTDLVLVWMLYTEESLDDFIIKTMNVSIVVFGVLLTITLVGFVLWPSYFADTGTMASKSLLGIRIGGGLLGANKSSALAALCIAWILLLNDKWNIKVGMLFGVSVIVMLFSQSRASLVMIPVIMFLKLFRPKEKHKYLYIAAILVIVFGVFSNLETIYTYLLRGQTAIQLRSGTGRFEIWSAASDYIKQQFVFGYGFGAGGEIVAKNIYGIATMHSAIYETLLGTGAIGLCMISIQYLYVVIKVDRNFLKNGFKDSLMDLVLLLYFLIRSLTSVGIGNWHSQEVMMWYYFMFVAGSGKGIQKTFKNLLRNGVC